MASVDAVTTIGRYLQEGGGKRARPILVLLAARLVGGVNDSAIQMAAVVEMIHTATLVHDDVIDIAKTRRGRPSSNAVWGNHTCVLAGDWLYMQAFQVALRERNFHVLDLLIESHPDDGRRRVAPARAHRQDRCLAKPTTWSWWIARPPASSRLARASAASWRGADEDVEARLGEFAWNLGIAFQLVDDVLDFTAREKVLGKPIGNDLREGKVTLPLIYALTDATPDERAMIQTVLNDGNYDRVPFDNILSFIEQRRGFERARERAQSFTDKAREIISKFPDSSYQKALFGITDLITERDH